MSAERHDRREFAKLLAAGGAGALLGPRAAVAEDETPADKSTREPEMTDDDADRDSKALTPPVLLTMFLANRYPHEKLNDDVLEKIERELTYALYRGRRLSRFPLTNADEPAFVFSAYRADD